MELFEIAVGSLLYDRLIEFTNTFQAFRDATGDDPDFRDPMHRAALLEWLNKWQCRQFSLECHPLASSEILAWYEEYRPSLLLDNVPLLDLDEQTLRSACKAYGDLMDGTASFRSKGGAKSRVTIGPTGASKILFALRPAAMVPWDEAMRKGLKYNGSQESYFEFLQLVRSDLTGLEKKCGLVGFKLEDLPENIGRPRATSAQLVGEYYYLTLTRGLRTEDFKRIKQYCSWSIAE
jgi:hypothetical protein